MHVDDGMVASNSKEMLHQFKEDLFKLYNIKWHDSPKEHLGIRITRDRANHSIHLSQENYLAETLEEYGMSDSNTAPTPIHHSTKLEAASDEEHRACEGFPYLEIIGKLNHAAVNTRPDLCHAVSSLAQFSSSYGKMHITAIKHLLRYVRGTLEYGLIFRKHDSPSRELVAYVDADYANDCDTRRSTTGYTITLGGSTVCWRTRRQRSVALSTTEAEYMAMGDCSKHVLWFRKLLYVLTGKHDSSTKIFTLPTTVFNDNNGAVFLSQEAAVNSRSKHIDIRHHFIRDLVKNNIILPAQIDTKDMPADFLTKAATKAVIDNCKRLTGTLPLQASGNFSHD